jgi:hypothetical protein
MPVGLFLLFALVALGFYLDRGVSHRDEVNHAEPLSKRLSRWIAASMPKRSRQLP